MIHTRFCDERGVGIVISILSSQRIDSLRCVCVLVFVLCFLFFCVVILFIAIYVCVICVISFRVASCALAGFGRARCPSLAAFAPDMISLLLAIFTRERNRPGAEP